AGKMPTGPTAKMGVLLIKPALRIFFVVERHGLFGKLERVLRVEHHCKLFCPCGIFAGYDRTGVRTVWNAARMQRNRSWFNPAPRSEISAYVKQNFVRFHIVVHPRNLHGFRMRIEHPWSESADNVTANFKCLMDRRGLVDGAGNRLEVLRIKREWINVAIPANHIEWMMRHRHLSPARTVLHQYFGIFILVDRQRFGWSMQVAL